MNNKLFIAVIFSSLIAASYAAGSCSASASVSRRTGQGQDWTSAEGKHSTYDLAIVNTGDCPLDVIHLQFTIPAAWNMNGLGNGTWSLSNFGASLNAGATYSSSGFVLQYPDQASVSVSVSYTSCLSCEPTSQPPTNPPSELPRELIQQLIMAPSEVDRQMMLADKQFVFDFKNSLLGVTQSAGGKTVATSRSNFPAVIGHNIAMTVGFIEPCGINLPHTHPRATEINFIASGRFQAGMFQENGARFIGNVLEAGMATVFPQGTIHFEINLDCEPAMFVAAFNNEDPGVQTSASSFFGLPIDVAAVSLNISSIQTVEDLARFLPMNPAVAMQDCMQRCGFSS